jgi:hypothetical protein
MLLSDSETESDPDPVHPVQIRFILTGSDPNGLDVFFFTAYLQQFSTKRFISSVRTVAERSSIFS